MDLKNTIVSCATKGRQTSTDVLAFENRFTIPSQSVSWITGSESGGLDCDGGAYNVDVCLPISVGGFCENVGSVTFIDA